MTCSACGKDSSVFVRFTVYKDGKPFGEEIPEGFCSECFRALVAAVTKIAEVKP